MFDDNNSPTLDLGSRLQAIEGKLDRVLNALSIEYSGSPPVRRIPKRPLRSSAESHSDGDNCGAGDSGQTTDESEGISEGSE